MTLKQSASPQTSFVLFGAVYPVLWRGGRRGEGASDLAQKLRIFNQPPPIQADEFTSG